MITWRPIEQLPDELKDGRQVLCWIEGFDAEVLTWSAHHENWCDKEDDIGFLKVSHFAEITPP